MDILSRSFMTQPQSVFAPPAPPAPAPPTTTQSAATPSTAAIDIASISKSESGAKSVQAPKADTAPQKNVSVEEMREQARREAEKNIREREKIMNDPKMLEEVMKRIQEITQMRK